MSNEVNDGDIDESVFKIDAADNVQKLKDFSNLLDQIEDLSEKKKKLWSEIYENAIVDRQIAYTSFRTLQRIVSNKSTEFAVHGRTLASYIERMSKANDQMIRLADLISRAEQKSDAIDSDDMFKQISRLQD